MQITTLLRQKQDGLKKHSIVYEPVPNDNLDEVPICSSIYVDKRALQKLNGNKAPEGITLTMSLPEARP